MKKNENSNPITVKKTSKKLGNIKKIKDSQNLDNTSGHIRSQSMSDVKLTDLINYDELNVSEKIKKQYEKKYIKLANRINALKKKDEDMESKMKGLQKKTIELEEIKKKKNDFKKELILCKKEKMRKLNEQKEKVKNMRIYEHHKQLTLQQMSNQKKKLLLEINKADQNLMKTMLSQTQSKTETNNRLKYLKEKDNKKRIKNNLIEFKENKIKTKKFNNKLNYNQNLNLTQNLKNKCKELEKLESVYKTELKYNQIKVNEIDPSNQYKCFNIPHIYHSNKFIHKNSNMQCNLNNSYNKIKDSSKNDNCKRNRLNKTPIPKRTGKFP